ncbi:hypothetical protein SAMN05216285_3451 [Natrinema salifodinae]|uniref:Uncharacterized protein n=1 Tax=Natrinema salifodinae TaxID=1202768 RepID=A0A1I0QEA0_9EURY|nr:hypothetical protein SAMN05216285_3451 [Natrinema salifodinae]
MASLSERRSTHGFFWLRVRFGDSVYLHMVHHFSRGLFPASRLCARGSNAVFARLADPRPARTHDRTATDLGRSQRPSSRAVDAVFLAVRAAELLDYDFLLPRLSELLFVTRGPPRSRLAATLAIAWSADSAPIVRSRRQPGIDHVAPRSRFASRSPASSARAPDLPSPAIIGPGERRSNAVSLSPIPAAHAVSGVTVRRRQVRNLAVSGLEPRLRMLRSSTSFFDTASAVYCGSTSRADCSYRIDPDLLVDSAVLARFVPSLLLLRIRRLDCHKSHNDILNQGPSGTRAAAQRLCGATGYWW